MGSECRMKNVLDKVNPPAGFKQVCRLIALRTDGKPYCGAVLTPIAGIECALKTR